jgi:hypothetical protein
MVGMLCKRFSRLLELGAESFSKITKKQTQTPANAFLSIFQLSLLLSHLLSTFLVSISVSQLTISTHLHSICLWLITTFYYYFLTSLYTLIHITE